MEEVNFFEHYEAHASYFIDCYAMAIVTITPLLDLSCAGVSIFYHDGLVRSMRLDVTADFESQLESLKDVYNLDAWSEQDLDIMESAYEFMHPLRDWAKQRNVEAI